MLNKVSFLDLPSLSKYYSKHTQYTFWKTSGSYAIRVLIAVEPYLVVSQIIRADKVFAAV